MASARVPLLAAAAFAVAFVAVYALAYGIAAIGTADATALHGLMQLRGSWIESPASLLARSANPLPYAAMLGLTLAWGVATRRYRETMAAVCLVALGILGAEVLKHVLAHQRFNAILGSHQIGAPAFPSGHATAAMTLALGAVLIAPPRWRPLAVVVGGAYAIAVCISILILGYHYPSDVFGGLLFATVCFCVAVAALRFTAEDDARSGARPSFGSAAWREAALLAGAGVVGITVGCAGSIAGFAGEHAIATAAAFAIAGCSAALIAVASLITDW